MKLGELVLQTYNMVDFLLANESSLDVKTKRDSLNGIIATFDSSLNCQENADEISSLRSLSSQEDFSASDLYILTVSALIRFCAAKLELIPALQSLINEKEHMLDNQSKRFLYQNTIQSAYHTRYPGTSERFSGKGIIYSVITGSYDAICEPTAEDDFEYVLLTDHEPENYNGKWQIRVVENRENLSAPRLSRYLKMHPADFFPEYDYSIYVDGSLQVVGDFKSFIAAYKKESGIICFPHHLNCDILEEAGSILENGNASQDELVRQIKNYQDQGYIGKGYIVEAGCMVRDHRDELLMKVMDDWWKEFCSYDHNRDQMSFDYSFWKNGYNYDLCDLPIYDNPWCKVLVVH